ncbi:hypothetical protein FKM82_018381 [Ascaphus truei]
MVQHVQGENMASEWLPYVSLKAKLPGRRFENFDAPLFPMGFLDLQGHLGQLPAQNRNVYIRESRPQEANDSQTEGVTVSQI